MSNRTREERSAAVQSREKHGGVGGGSGAEGDDGKRAPKKRKGKRRRRANGRRARVARRAENARQHHRRQDRVRQILDERHQVRFAQRPTQKGQRHDPQQIRRRSNEENKRGEVQGEREEGRGGWGTVRGKRVEGKG